MAQPVFAVGMKPLSTKAMVAVIVDDTPFTLMKGEVEPIVRAESAKEPDITFTIPKASVTALRRSDLSDVATTGIAILKLLLHPDPALRASVKVHIGLFDLMRLGYLSVLRLGGAPMVKFLAAHGLTGMGKIKEAITKLRDHDGRR
ncbi:MAG: hypothetical protein HYR96_03545 [Deltaproteobacteria bacterium]|nr:hypothetical protein [Deltaproteobacteria bacterium]